MPTLGGSYTLLCGLIIALAAGPCLAETLNLECKVTWTKPTGQSRQAKRKLEIDTGAKQVKTYDDLGKGYKLASTHAIGQVSPDKIDLDDSPSKTSYVNRKTGQYYFKNAKNGYVIKGPCRKSDAVSADF
jgi:hypothetical protein